VVFGPPRLVVESRRQVCMLLRATSSSCMLLIKLKLNNPLHADHTAKEEDVFPTSDTTMDLCRAE